MILKAINQDEFRDFSFINSDWKIRDLNNNKTDSQNTVLASVTNSLNSKESSNALTENSILITTQSSATCSISTSLSFNSQASILRSQSPQSVLNSSAFSSSSSNVTAMHSNTSSTILNSNAPSICLNKNTEI